MVKPNMREPAVSRNATLQVLPLQAAVKSRY